MISPANPRRATPGPMFEAVFVPDREGHNVLPALSRLLIQIDKARKQTQAQAQHDGRGDGGPKE